MRAIRCALLLAGLVAGLVAGPAAGGEPPALILGATNNMSSIAAFVGVEKGLFLKPGLDVKVKVFNTGQEMVKALERGLKVKSVAAWMGRGDVPTHDDAIGIVAGPGRGVVGVADLAGKTVGTAVGGTGELYAQVVLRKQGIAADKVKFLNVPPGAQVAALQGGRVDVLAAWEPYITLAMEKIPGAVLVARGGGHICWCAMLHVPVEMAERSPALVRGLVAGWAAATQYTRQHPDEAGEIATRWIPGLDGAVARKVIRALHYDPRITRATLKAFDDAVEMLLDQKKLRTKVTSESYDDRFLKDVMREHPELFADLPAAR